MAQAAAWPESCSLLSGPPSLTVKLTAGKIKGIEEDKARRAKSPEHGPLGAGGPIL